MASDSETPEFIPIPIREEKDNDLTREQLDRSAQELHKNEETTVEAGFKPGFIVVEGSNAHLPAGKESSPYKGNDGTLDSECFFKSPSIGKVQCEDTPRLPETEHSIEAELSNQAEIAIAENRNQQQNYNLDAEEEMNQEITEQQNLRAGEETLEQVIPEQEVEIFPNEQVPKCLNAQEDADLGTYKEVVDSREDQTMDASVSALVKTTNSMTMEVGPAANSYNREGHKASTLDSNQIFRVETTEEHDAQEITVGEEAKTKKIKEKVSHLMAQEMSRSQQQKPGTHRIMRKES
ncbi:hypothetical protein Nepgr_025763 [Nepenthes gracilis]|uniref:Uncharacterized protein n=1 Tax=Nepenthes gracilis TaxID=150966 RepID=A0AAD3T6M2_NEPGR|nr:hypothetical protein Nepgr_025763 [Nepenthes gracilis]